MLVPLRTINDLKCEGHYFAAGALAHAKGQPMQYGCHFGMRSEREEAIQAFNAGYEASRQAFRL